MFLTSLIRKLGMTTAAQSLTEEKDTRNSASAHAHSEMLTHVAAVRVGIPRPRFIAVSSGAASLCVGVPLNKFTARVLVALWRSERRYTPPWNILIAATENMSLL